MYCKAGFKHFGLDDCDHIVPLPVVPAKSFELPDEYYSEEAIARRRLENKRKYQPQRVRMASKRILVGNEATEMI